MWRKSSNWDMPGAGPLRREKAAPCSASWKPYPHVRGDHRGPGILKIKAQTYAYRE